MTSIFTVSRVVLLYRIDRLVHHQCVSGLRGWWRKICTVIIQADIKADLHTGHTIIFFPYTPLLPTQQKTNVQWIFEKRNRNYDNEKVYCGYEWRDGDNGLR